MILREKKETLLAPPAREREGRRGRNAFWPPEEEVPHLQPDVRRTVLMGVSASHFQLNTREGPSRLRSCCTNPRSQGSWGQTRITHCQPRRALLLPALLHSEGILGQPVCRTGPVFTGACRHKSKIKGLCLCSKECLSPGKMYVCRWCVSGGGVGRVKTIFLSLCSNHVRQGLTYQPAFASG